MQTKYIKTLVLTLALTGIVSDALAHRIGRAHRHVTQEQLDKEEEERVQKLRDVVNRTQNTSEEEREFQRAERINGINNNGGGGLGDGGFRVNETPRERRNRQREEARENFRNRDQSRALERNAGRDFQRGLEQLQRTVRDFQ